MSNIVLTGFESNHSKKTSDISTETTSETKIMNKVDVEEKIPYKCHYCQKEFALKSYRRKHIKRVHDKTAQGKDLVIMKPKIVYKMINIKLLKTELPSVIVKDHDYCSKEVPTNMMDEEAKKNYTCDYCKKDFALATYLFRHMRRVHGKTSKGNDIVKKVTFICESCDKEFKSKASMQRHRNVVHFPQERFSCEQCNFTTGRQDHLKRHKQRTHNGKARKEKTFKCTFCTASFSHKNNLSRHNQIKHNVHLVVKSKINRKCPLCDFSSSGSRKKEINDHFKNEHNLKMDWHKFKLQDEKEFYDWKNDLEIKNNISFVRRQYKTERSLRYICHRSGKYKSFSTNKRKLKIAGSCKINAYCPCEIVATTQADGQISVCYLPTHVGHQNELKHLRLKTEDRRKSATKLLAKSPHDEICLGVGLSVSNNELNPIHLVNNKDLNNIEKSFNVDEEAEKHPYNPASIEAWVHELRTSKDTSQLIYKPQGEYDPQFPNLKQEDFVLIYMTEAQKSMLEWFGRDIVCTDSTHGANKYNFQLYTLLTIDESREGFPCAFMFSNRGDSLVMSLFYQSIKDKVGPISPSVFMSDMEDTFYSAWTNIMGPANLHLFCTWNVLKAWRSNLHKIKNKEKKQEVYNTLKTIMYEMDPLTFHELLNAAILQFDGDAETHEYCKYFQEQYIKGDAYKNWAYCYRVHSKINTSMSLDNFNRVLKFCYLRGKKIQRLDKTLCAILNFIRDKLFDYLIKVEMVKLVSKQQILRRRHKTAIVTYTDKDVLPDGDNKWNVISSTGQDLYTVIKVKDCKTCQLQCLHCDSCFHEYICTCLDNSIKTNMCKHIHAVSRTIQQANIITPLLDDDNSCASLISFSTENEIILEQISQDSGHKMEEKREKIADMFKMIMEEATTEERLNFVDTKFMTIYQAVRSAWSTTYEQPLQAPEHIE